MTLGTVPQPVWCETAALAINTPVRFTLVPLRALMPQAPTASVVPAPVTAYERSELAAALRRVCDTSEVYWNTMSAAEFAAPLGTAWSPADHVRHLTISVRAVHRGLRIPGPLLHLLFGAASQSRRYAAVVERYQAALRAGGLAGRFTPRPLPAVGDAAQHRERVLAEHRAAVDALAEKVLALSHDLVDVRRLPHPLLGKLTVREMLMFTLYHNQHHVWVVAGRRGETSDLVTPLHGSAQ